VFQAVALLEAALLHAALFVLFFAATAAYQQLPPSQRATRRSFLTLLTPLPFLPLVAQVEPSLFDTEIYNPNKAPPVSETNKKNLARRARQKHSLLKAQSLQ